MSDDHTLDAHRCPNGHLTYPGHPRCPECGEPQEGTVDLSERTAEVVTWTTNTATPPGVRSTNSLAIVEFDVDGERVRAIGQLVEDAEVDIGDEVVELDRDMVAVEEEFRAGSGEEVAVIDVSFGTVLVFP